MIIQYGYVPKRISPPFSAMLPAEQSLTHKPYFAHAGFPANQGFRRQLRILLRGGMEFEGDVAVEALNPIAADGTEALTFCPSIHRVLFIELDKVP